MSIMQKPNILLFVPHDLGDYLGCYGHKSVRSPNIDALADGGVRFSQYFTPAPECTPSRSSMMTGLYTHQNGLMGLSNFGWALRPEVSHLAALMSGAGYATHHFGFQHETHESPKTLGYQQTHPTDGSEAPSVCSALQDFLSGDEARNEPWLAHAGFFHVHRPWPENADFSERDVEVPPYLPDTPIIRRDVARFHQSIWDMDCAIGGVMDALERYGLKEETLVIFTTDHGPAFPHAKATFYDPGICIPLIMRWPGTFGEGRCQDELLSNIDFTPTLLDLCEIPMPDSLAGRSFLPLLTDQPYRERDAVYGALYYDVSYDPMYYVRTRNHKYIRSFGVTDSDAAGADHRVLATHESGKWIRVDDLDVMTAPAWQEMQVDCSVPPAEELYDLEADPLEMNDIARDPDAEDILGTMRDLLRNMMAETDSPLPGDHVAPPPAQVEAARRFQPGKPDHEKKVSERWDRIV